MQKKYPVVCQAWLESERGWGTRPDGYSYHKTLEDREKFIKAYWSRMPDHVPDEYSCPVGDPYVVEVSEKTYRLICKEKLGIRSFAELK